MEKYRLFSRIKYILPKVEVWSHRLTNFCSLIHHSRKDFSFFYSEEEGNTGFYFARANSKVQLIWDEYFKIAADDRSMKKDEQALFWASLRFHGQKLASPLGECSAQLLPNLSTTVANTCFVDTCISGTGAVTSPQAFESLKYHLMLRNMSVVAVHANFLIGNHLKVARLNASGLWLAKRDENGQWIPQCENFNASSLVPLGLEAWGGEWNV